MTYISHHSHSYYSLLDGFSSPEELVARAVELEMPGIAITDHGNLTGHREMYKAAQAAGIKPILGIEAYFTADKSDRRARKDRLPDDKVYNHIILLAKNDIGLVNISKMSEVAYRDGFYFKPRMDYALLEEHKEGVIVLSGCMNGVIAQSLINGNDLEALSQAQWFQHQFGDDFYMEIQPHNEKELNLKSLALADDLGISPVLTLDCHYASPEFRAAEEIMLAVGTNAKVIKESNQATAKRIPDVIEKLDYLYGDRQMSFKDLDLYLMSRAEAYKAMEAQGILREDMFENTIEIADKVSGYDLPQGLDLLPVDIKSKSPHDDLRELAEEGLGSRGLNEDRAYVDRLNEELSIIEAKNFSQYFLVVADMIQWAKGQGIVVGPGRGSSAGSLVCYALGITEVDPIEHNLLFFRFIDLERADFPDVDTDIEDRRRGEVKEYLREKYGHVASIATYNTYKDKNSIKDVARIFGLSFSEVNDVLKGVDDLDEFKKSPRGKKFIAEYPEVMEYAELLYGRVRSTGIHAAGIVTSNRPIHEVAPVEYRKEPNSDEQVPVVALDMEQVADVGLIKVDCLGLKTLSVIGHTLELIERRKRKKINLVKLPLNDPRVYDMLSEGRTKGVFQAEQGAYTGLLIKMGVSNFADLAASNALVRPGAMNSIGAEYIARKNGARAASYVHSDMRAYTEETYGLHVYQEQVMLTCVEIGGMTKGEANYVRKIIGKKKDVKEFDQYREKFVTGASEKISKKDAEKLWQDFEAHANYSFNKSHAVAYSMLTYWTAYLKLYYPLEFMLALLQNESDKDTRMEYLIEAKRMGIQILLPHINSSAPDFTIEGDGIRFGLNSVKYISDKVAGHIIASRPYANFKEFTDVAGVKFSGINSRAVTALNNIGAAAFTDNPRRGDEKEYFYEYLGLPEFSADIPEWVTAKFNSSEEFNEKGQFVIFGMVKGVKRGKGWSRIDIVDQVGSIGVFDEEATSIQPGQAYVFAIAKNSIIDYCKPEDVIVKKGTLAKFLMSPSSPCASNERVCVGIKERTTKAGSKMATVLFCDDMEELESALVFSYNYDEVARKVKPGHKFKPVFSRTRDGALTIKEIR